MLHFLFFFSSNFEWNWQLTSSTHKSNIIYIYQWKKIKTFSWFSFTKKWRFFSSSCIKWICERDATKRDDLFERRVQCSFMLYTLTFTHVSSHIPNQPGFLILPFCLYIYTLFHSVMCQAFQCSLFSISFSQFHSFVNAFYVYKCLKETRTLKNERNKNVGKIFRWTRAKKNNNNKCFQ